MGPLTGAWGAGRGELGERVVLRKYNEKMKMK